MYLSFSICKFSKIQRRCPQLMQIKDQHFPTSSYKRRLFSPKLSLSLRRNIPFLYTHCHCTILFPACHKCNVRQRTLLLCGWLFLSPCKNWCKAIRCSIKKVSYQKSSRDCWGPRLKDKLSFREVMPLTKLAFPWGRWFPVSPLQRIVLLISYISQSPGRKLVSVVD